MLAIQHTKHFQHINRVAMRQLQVEMLILGVHHPLLESADRLPNTPSHDHARARDRNTLEEIPVMQPLGLDIAVRMHNLLWLNPNIAARLRSPVHPQAKDSIDRVVASQMSHLRAELPRQPDIVSVKNRNELAARKLAPAVASGGDAAIRLIDDANIASELC